MQTIIMMNDFRRQWQATGAAVLQATERVGASGWFVLGPEVAEFERLLAEGCGCAHAIGCGSGLDAIELSLRALGLVEGDRVLTTPLSAFATTLAIVRAGGTPVFVDVDENGLLDLGKVEQVLSADPTIRYLVPVHLYGQPLNLEDLEALKRRFGIFIVEDCAQAIGATWEGRPVGGVGDLSTLSFYPTKNLGALGDGGAILTNDRNLMLKCQSLRDYGQTGKYEHTLLGLNSRLDELHAAILRTAFLPRLSDWSTRRRDIASQYLSEIAHPQVKMLRPSHEARGARHLFPIILPDRVLRDNLVEHLRKHCVQTAVHYPTLIPDQAALAGVRQESCGPLDVARALSSRELSIPIHPYLEREEVSRVIEAINQWPPTTSRS